MTAVKMSVFRANVSGREVGEWALAFAVVCAVMVVFDAQALASTGSGSMPWESTLTSVLASIEGPIARFVGILAIVTTGLAFALGEGGPMFKKGMGILFGLSIAFGASTFITALGFGGAATI